jgi:hypothetical protein
MLDDIVSATRNMKPLPSRHPANLLVIFPDFAARPLRSRSVTSVPEECSLSTRDMHSYILLCQRSLIRDGSVSKRCG